MEQAAFAELEPGVKKRRTRREAFFEKMDGLFLGVVWRSGSRRSIRRPGAVGVPVRWG